VSPGAESGTKERVQEKERKREMGEEEERKG